MTGLLSNAITLTPQQKDSGKESGNYSAHRTVAQFAAVVLILFVYSYPSLKTRADFGPTSLPPIFAPDLSLYLNLSTVKTVGSGQVLNPYYLVPVPSSGTAYLKFRLGAALFSAWSKLFAGRLWLAMFVWNLFWWGLLCAVALWLFEHFLPMGSCKIVLGGLGVLMLVNTGMAKPLLAAWIHLPSLSGFQSVSLPFMRAFSPQIPIPLLLGYLGLQMGALRGRSLYHWVAMAVIQLLALSAFPYATLMMAGITFVSVSGQLLSPGEARHAWHIPLVYGAACAVADGIFLRRGSMAIYASHSSTLHFQPQLLPSLVGGVWLLLCLLTVATAFSKTFPAEVKWPLVGLGGTNVLLMLGDSVVPSTVLLLSAHATYFAHTTVAVLFTFLVSGALVRAHMESVKTGIILGVVLFVLALNGVLLSLGAFRAFLPANRDQIEVVRLLSSSRSSGGELFVARSRVVDDACGWVALLSRGPVLFCTDAETILTPLQNRDVHRFRQALYLYFSGKDKDYLESVIRSANPGPAMYQLGFWAEATSLSRDEQQEGLRGIQVDLIPALGRIERHDPAVSQFFHQFRRILVVEDLHDRVFDSARLSSFLRLEGEQYLDHWELLSYVPE